MIFANAVTDLFGFVFSEIGELNSGAWCLIVIISGFVAVCLDRFYKGLYNKKYETQKDVHEVQKDIIEAMKKDKDLSGDRLNETLKQLYSVKVEANWGKIVNLEGADVTIKALRLLLDKLVDVCVSTNYLSVFRNKLIDYAVVQRLGCPLSKMTKYRPVWKLSSELSDCEIELMIVYLKTINCINDMKNKPEKGIRIPVEVRRFVWHETLNSVLPIAKEIREFDNEFFGKDTAEATDLVIHSVEHAAE